MPRGVQKSVPAIFEKFVSSLSVLIKEKVAESVQTATSDFFVTKFGQTATEEPKQVRRRRRRRRFGKKLAEKVAAVVGRKRGGKRGPKPVKLSKYGKRLGRPPKAVAAAPVKEEVKTE